MIAAAVKDLLEGRDAAKVLSWINGNSASLTFSMACSWLDVSPQVMRERLEKIAANPAAYREPLKLIAFRTAAR